MDLCSNATRTAPAASSSSPATRPGAGSGHRSITPEHLLLGLIREGKGLDSRIFSRAGLNPDAFRREIEARLVFEEKIPTSVEIPFSDAAKRVLQFAAMEADRLLHNYIGPEHLLLGLLHERSTIAAELLNVHGLRLDDVRQQIVILVNEQSSPIGAMGLASHPVTPHRDRDTARFFASAITLKSLLAHVLNVDANRLEVPPDLDRRLLSLARERRTVFAPVVASVAGLSRSPPLRRCLSRRSQIRLLGHHSIRWARCRCTERRWRSSPG